jgi:DNA primase
MDAVAEVKSRLNIEDVIGEYVQLKRAGRNFKGLSPFSNEKTPSFIVSPEKQIWHDFSSGKGGDVFTFVQEVEGLDFRGSLDLLARRAGVDLDQFHTSATGTNTKLKGRTLDALELAATFYQKQLPANQAALEYLVKDRKFNKQTILTWRLGYAPNTGHALTDFLTKRGFERDEMKRAGLAVDRSGRLGDMFRGRIMVPLADSQGRIIGFTARLLADEPNAPKYINTPQTMVYDKSRNVYGLHLAKESIRKTAIVVVVEGNLDVISSYQADVTNVVASAGTAMTESHLRELKRFTGDIRLCFDADQAGIAATERIIPLAQKLDINLKIVTIEGAKDPDELVQKDVKEWKKVIDKAVYAPDWLIEQYKHQLDLGSAQGKRMFTDVLLTVIRRLRDPVEQEHYLKLIAGLTESSFEAVQAKFNNDASQSQEPRQKKPKLSTAQLDRATIEYQRFQDHFLAMNLAQPKIRHLLKDCHEVFFAEGNQRTLFNFLRENPKFKGDPKLAEQLREVSDYVKIIVLQFEELYQDLPPNDLEEEAGKLKHRLINRYVKMQNQKIAKELESVEGEARRHALMQKADKLNELIQITKVGE